VTGILRDKVAIVTGAGSGIGLATARRFAQEGAQVLAVDLRKEGIETLAREVAAVVPTVGDVTNAADIARILDVAHSRFGKLDILVNNAGISGPTTQRLHELALADFDTVMGVNIRAPLAMLQKAIPLMLQQRSGVIVNVVSHAAFATVPRNGSYCISKAALLMLTKMAAAEYAAEGIRVVGIAPGVTSTPLLGALPQEHLDKIVASIPQQRIASPDEMAAAILFLASSEASYVNGAILNADGAASV